MKNLFFVMIFTIFLIGFTSSSFSQMDDKVVVLNTQSGKIVIEFFTNDAPNHVENFLSLTESKFYDETLFHRIIPGFMIQGGDPLTKDGAYETPNEWGTGGPEHTVNQEFNDIKHVRGIVSMARSNDPNSAGSQFFIVHADSSHLDGQYTVFGRIITQESFETLDKIASLDTTNTRPNDPNTTKILSTEIKNKSEISNLLVLDEPLRTSNVDQPTEQLYNNEKLGIEFSAPPGWLIQEPEKTRPDVPDVVAVTPGNIVNPSFSVTITYADNKTLDEHMVERKKIIQSSIDSGTLRITGEEKVNLYDRESHVIQAIGTFEFEEIIDVQFTEVTFLESGKIYALTYTSEASEFLKNENNFDKFLKTFAVTKENNLQPASIISDNSQSTDNGDDNGCLIATATYDSELAPQVQQLREIRDNSLLQTQSGTTFMTGFNQFYYTFSPTIADWERQNPAFKEAVKITITPLISSLAILNYVNIDSEAEMLGYGIGVIVMNIGMYFVAPAVVLYRVFRK